MSHEKVAIVEAATNAYNREDWDALFQAAAPGFELDMSRSIGPARGVYGLDQLRRFLEDSPTAGSPFGSSRTSSSKPAISW